MAARASRRFVPIRSTADFTRDRERERESCYRMGKERREKKRESERPRERYHLASANRLDYIIVSREQRAKYSIFMWW